MTEEDELDFGEDVLSAPSPVREVPRALPPGWTAKLSATTGDTYYKQESTGSSFWTIPESEWARDTPPIEDKREFPPDPLP